MMWQFHLRSGDPAWRKRAEHYSKLLEHRQHDRNVHDLGFIFLSTYLPWYELTGETHLHEVLIQAGRTLAMRFMDKGQYLRSFVAPESLFIDIMMNVPIIFYAASETGDRELARVAAAHCRTTRDTIVRPDGSTAHEGIFDLETGQFLRQATHQGLCRRIGLGPRAGLVAVRLCQVLRPDRRAGVSGRRRAERRLLARAPAGRRRAVLGFRCRPDAAAAAGGPERIECWGDRRQRSLGPGPADRKRPAQRRI